MSAKRRVPEEKAATLEEVEAAVAALTDDDLVRIAHFAKRRIERIGRAADMRDHEDLAAEAYELTLNGSRSWNKDVSFTQYLLGVMRSVSSHWAEKYRTEMESGRDQVRTDVDVRMELVRGERGTNDPRIAEERTQKLAAIRALFEDDPLASNILAGLAEGLQGPEICSLLEIDGTTFSSKLRSMRRDMIRAGLKRPTKTEKGPWRGQAH